jgi:hypothetical protein
MQAAGWKSNSNEPSRDYRTANGEEAHAHPRSVIQGTQNCDLEIQNSATKLITPKRATPLLFLLMEVATGKNHTICITPAESRLGLNTLSLTLSSGVTTNRIEMRGVLGSTLCDRSPYSDRNVVSSIARVGVVV